MSKLFIQRGVTELPTKNGKYLTDEGEMRWNGKDWVSALLLDDVIYEGGVEWWLEPIEPTTDFNSTAIIGSVKDRYDELPDKMYDWSSFYTGWLEGRADFLPNIFAIKAENTKLQEKFDKMNKDRMENIASSAKTTEQNFELEKTVSKLQEDIELAKSALATTTANSIIKIDNLEQQVKTLTEALEKIRENNAIGGYSYNHMAMKEIAKEALSTINK